MSMLINPHRFGVAVTDPNWAAVMALLHFDGADGSTAFVDQTGRTWTATGNAQLDTAAPKFGTAAGLFDGAGDYIETQSSSAYQLGAGDFTIEMFVNFASFSGQQNFFEINSNLGTNPADRLVIYVFSSDPRVRFWQQGDRVISSVILSLNTYYHLAVVRVGNVFTLYVNGVSQGTWTSSVSLNQARLRLGSDGSAHMNGKVDEFRFTKGAARYTGNFTPPVAPFPSS